MNTPGGSFQVPWPREVSHGYRSRLTYSPSVRPVAGYSAVTPGAFRPCRLRPPRCSPGATGEHYHTRRLFPKRSVGRTCRKDPTPTPPGRGSFLGPLRPEGSGNSRAYRHTFFVTR